MAADCYGASKTVSTTRIKLFLILKKVARRRIISVSVAQVTNLTLDDGALGTASPKVHQQRGRKNASIDQDGERKERNDRLM